MMRIGVSGPGGTGKTTLVETLCDELSYPKIEEGVWGWIARERSLGPWSLTESQQLQMQRHAIAYKMRREVSSAFVSDRTTVDAVSLMTLRMERLGSPVPERLRVQALRHARGAYDIAVVLGPTRASDALDDVAMMDSTLRPREHALTLKLYRSLRTRVIQVPALPATEIAPFVLAEVRKGLSRV